MVRNAVRGGAEKRHQGRDVRAARLCKLHVHMLHQGISREMPEALNGAPLELSGARWRR